MNLLGIWTNYYLSYSTSINFTCPLGKLRENSSAQSQNKLASGYWKLLSLHAFLVTWMNSYFITVHFTPIIFSLLFNTCIKIVKVGHDTQTDGPLEKPPKPRYSSSIIYIDKKELLHYKPQICSLFMCVRTTCMSGLWVNNFNGSINRFKNWFLFTWVCL